MLLPLMLLLLLPCSCYKRVLSECEYNTMNRFVELVHRNRGARLTIREPYIRHLDLLTKLKSELSVYDVCVCFVVVANIFVSFPYSMSERTSPIQPMYNIYFDFSFWFYKTTLPTFPVFTLPICSGVISINSFIVCIVNLTLFPDVEFPYFSLYLPLSLSLFRMLNDLNYIDTCSSVLTLYIYTSRLKIFAISLRILHSTPNTKKKSFWMGELVRLVLESYLICCNRAQRWKSFTPYENSKLLEAVYSIRHENKCNITKRNKSVTVLNWDMISYSYGDIFLTLSIFRSFGPFVCNFTCVCVCL